MKRPFNLLFTIFYMWPVLVMSQVQFTALQDQLAAAHQRYGVTFTYDASAVKGYQVPVVDTTFSLDEYVAHLDLYTNFEVKLTGNQFASLLPLESPKQHEFCLKVVDEMDGGPLPGAAVSIAGKAIGLSSDAQGMVKGKTTYELYDSLRLHFIGFDMPAMPLISAMGDGCPQIEMKWEAISLDNIVIEDVVAAGIDFHYENLSTQVKMDDLALIPGETDGDILHSVRALPGILSPTSKAGELYIRGSAPEENFMLIDNVPVYHRGHYFGTISPYNPKVIESVSIFKSGYEVDLGGRTGGAVLLETPSSPADSMEFGVGVNTLFSEGLVKLTERDAGFGAVVGARIAHPSGWMSPKLEAISDLVFQTTVLDSEAVENNSVTDFSYWFADLNFSVVQEIGEDHQLKFSGLGVTNDMSWSQTLATANTSTSRVITMDNVGLNVDLISDWTPDFSSEVSATASYYDYRFGLQSDSDSLTGHEYQNAINTLRDYSLKAKFSKKLSDQNYFRFGGELAHHDVFFIFEDEQNALGNAPLRISDRDAQVISGFAKYQHIDPGKWTYNFGLRSSYFTLTKETYFEPRIFTSYALNPFNVIKGSAGSYNQYLVIEAGQVADNSGLGNQLWVLANGKEDQVIRGKQAMLGWQHIKHSWKLDIELYGKHTDNLVYNNLDFPNVDARLTSVKGDVKTYGIDLLLAKSWNGVDAWMAYGYNLATLYRKNGEVSSTPTYQPHAFNTAVNYDWRNFRFSAGWFLASGTPELSYDGVTYADQEENPQNDAEQQLPDTEGPPDNPGPGGPGPGSGPGPGPDGPSPPSENGPGSVNQAEDGIAAKVLDTHLPFQHQLDISISYAYRPKGHPWHGAIGLSLLNVYDQENYAPQVIRAGIDNNYTIGFSPNLSINIYF